MDLDALRFGDFSTLGEAVTDWKQMVGKLETLAKDARDGLKAKADKADWSGKNADVSRGFITKTVGEFEDAHTQANSIYKILSDTRDELIHYRGRLQDLVTEADGAQIRVRDTGRGSFRVEAKEGADDVPQSKIDSYKTKIEDVLGKAAESDSTAADVLKSLVKQSKYGFSDASYQDRDSAAKALKEGERAAKLAKDPSKLSAKEFDELNRLLKDNGKDDLFSERFAAQLGPKGTLDFWQGVNDPRNRELMEARRGDYDDLQKNLSMTLAQATQSDSPSMQNWERDMVKSGTSLVGQGPPGQAIGFQVMSSLMRYGDYDDKFLTDYGKSLIDEEKRRSHNGKAPGWNPALTPMLNHTGTDAGVDPMTGYMKALSNSPEAATEFFNDDYVTKDEDSDFENEDGDNIRKSNFQYLFDEREWPEDQDSKGETSIAGKNYLGHALEAATTGHPAGREIPKDLPPHNAGQAKLFEDIVGSVADNDKRLTDHGYMSDSLGKITANYLPDINRAVADDPLGDTNKLYPLAGAQAEPDHADVTRFLVSVGQNPEGYSAIQLGQTQYAANLMDYHLDPDLPKDSRFSDDPQDTIERISRQSGEIGGTLSVGRQEAVLGPAEEEDKAFTDAMAQGKNAVSGAIGTGIGVGTSFIATPVGGAAAGGAASTASSMLLEEVFGAYEPNAKNEAAKIAGGDWEEGREDHIYLNQRAAQLAAQAHGVPYKGDIADWAHTGTSDGFNDAHSNVSEMADDLDTDV